VLSAIHSITLRCRAGQGRAGQGRAGQGRAGQDREGRGRVGQGRAWQGRIPWAATLPSTLLMLAARLSPSVPWPPGDEVSFSRPA
jgi:hypothetical protein